MRAAARAQRVVERDAELLALVARLLPPPAAVVAARRARRAAVLHGADLARFATGAQACLDEPG